MQEAAAPIPPTTESRASEGSIYIFDSARKQQQQQLHDEMTLQGANSKFRMEISYSSILIALWAALLSWISMDGGFPGQGAVILLLMCAALKSPHGESRMILPLVFLSERCIANVTSIGHSPLDFYASAMLSYLTLSASHNERNGRRATGINTVAYAATGLGVLWLVVKDSVVSFAAAVFIVVGYVFYLKLSPHLGENEAVLVATFVGFFACDVVVNNEVGESGRAALLTRPGYLTTYTHIASRGTILSAIYLMAVMTIGAPYCTVSTNRYSKSAERRVSVRRTTALFWGAFFAIIGVMYAAVSYQFKEDAMLWLWAYINSSPLRLNALLMWFTGIPFAVLCIDLFTKDLRKTVRRKLFHLVAVVAFVPYAILDPPFLSFALSTATSIAIIIEVARHHQVYGSSLVTHFVVDHIDHRDSTTGVVRSHIYLLFGFGVSMMMRYRHVLVFSSPMPTVVQMASDIIPGVISLGIVDAAAAVVGSMCFLPYRRTLGRYLKNSLFTERANSSITHKTTTGTIGGLLSGIAVWTTLLLVVYLITLNPANSKTVAGLGHSFNDNHAQVAGNTLANHWKAAELGKVDPSSKSAPSSARLVSSIVWTSPLTWYSYVLVFISTVTECFMDGVDNLQLPMVVYGAVLSLYSLLLRNNV